MSDPGAQAKPVLVEDGWRKRSGNFYTRPLGAGVQGLLALAPNRGLPYQWRLQPYVGVIHARVNELARALTGSQSSSPYPQDTVRHRLVALLEGPDAYEKDRWLIATDALDGNEAVFREVAAHARTVGLPWMEKRTSLEAVVYELGEGNGPFRRTPYLTAALWLKGDVEAAQAWLAQVESQFGTPAPDVAEPLTDLRVTAFGSSAPPEGWPRQDFDAFAARLRAGMAQHPEGPPDGWRPEPA